MAYIAHLTGGGFCIPGADPLVLPVISTAPTGSLTPPALTWGASWTRSPAAWRGTGRLCRGQRARRSRCPRSSPSVLPLGRADRGACGACETAGPARGLELPVTSTGTRVRPTTTSSPELTPGADEHASHRLQCHRHRPDHVLLEVAGHRRRLRLGDLCVPLPHTWDSSRWPRPTITAGFANRLSYDTTNHRLRMNGYWDGSIHHPQWTWRRATLRTRPRSAHCGAG